MCWNKEVSLITFIIAIIGVIYLYKRNNPNDRWIAFFAGVVALIQLAEFFMWTDIQNGSFCGNITRYACIFALIVLALEPLANILGGLIFSDNSNKNILKLLLISYIIFIGWCYYKFVYVKNINWCASTACDIPKSQIESFFNEKSCNLKWYFLDTFNGKAGIIWILFLLIPFLTMTPKAMGILFLILGVITFFMAKIANNAAQGSLWCWLAIGIIFFKIIIG